MALTQQGVEVTVEVTVEAVILQRHTITLPRRRRPLQKLLSRLKLWLTRCKMCLNLFFLSLFNVSD